MSDPQRYAMTEDEIQAILPHVTGAELQAMIQRGITLDERAMIAKALKR